MVQQTLTTTTYVAMMDAYEKTWSYNELPLADDFIPFAIKIYECFHSHVDSFFIACA
jgi:hypothetical protein